VLVRQDRLDRILAGFYKIKSGVAAAEELSVTAEATACFSYVHSTHGDYQPRQILELLIYDWVEKTWRDEFDDVVDS
jgi:hypothetical protein